MTDDTPSNTPDTTPAPTDRAARGRFAFLKKRQPRTQADEQLAAHEAKREYDRQLVLKVTKRKNRRVPSWTQLQQLPRFLSATERQTVGIAGLGVLIACAILFINFWFFTLTPIPANGGDYSEGLIGAPKFINPVLSAANEVDNDISSLVFCSLLDRHNGQLVTDVAESYTVSDDAQVYVITLRQDVQWHDGTPLTAGDILFTFDLIQDADVASPLAKTFAGVRAEQIDERTIQFILDESFPPFLHTLTFGILPEKYWAGVDPAAMRLSELNLKPIGCGPFAFDSLKRERQGAIRSLTLAAFDDYHDGRPYLDTVTFKFYDTFAELETAVLNKNVLAASYLPISQRGADFTDRAITKGWQQQLLNLPEYSAIFFNQDNNTAVQDLAVRQALSQAIDRQRIVRTIFSGEAEVVTGPILAGMPGYDETVGAVEYRPTAAAEQLDAAGWPAIDRDDYEQLRAETLDDDGQPTLPEPGEQDFFRIDDNEVLQITLTAVDQPLSAAVAAVIADNWQSIGVMTDVVLVDPTQVRRTVLRPRQYQALLYSEILGPDPDPYPFWHSSQVADPGLNLALFADRKADTLLEQARQTTDRTERAEAYTEFSQILADQVPALFLYRPFYPYWINERVDGSSVETIAVPTERLSDMEQRYIKTKRVWLR